MPTASEPAPRPCPFCRCTTSGSGFPYANRYLGYDFCYRRCRKCDTRFIDPLPDDALRESLFAPQVYHAAYYEDVKLETYDAAAGRIAALLPAGSTVLDYGCGNGHMLSALARQGLRPVGVEMSKAGAQGARSRTRQAVYAANASEWRQRQYDCIHLRDVIPHLPEPLAVMNSLLSFLRPGGILFVEGSVEANRSLVYLAAQLFERIKRVTAGHSVGSFAPYHLVFSTAASQRAFFKQLDTPLTELKWEISETGWPYRHNGTVRNIIALAAIAASKVPGLRGLLGNRFVAIFETRPTP